MDSGVSGLDTCEVLLTMVPGMTLALTLTISVKVADSPGARVAFETETVPVAPVAGFVLTQPDVPENL
jgi:hypothetical protein